MSLPLELCKSGTVIASLSALTYLALTLAWSRACGNVVESLPWSKIGWAPHLTNIDEVAPHIRIATASFETARHKGPYAKSFVAKETPFIATALLILLAANIAIDGYAFLPRRPVKMFQSISLTLQSFEL